MNLEEYKEGQKFTIHGAYIERCSGKKGLVEFTLVTNDGRPIIFPRKPNEKLKDIRMMIEESLTTSDDPIKYRGCKWLKVHYLNDNKDVTHNI